MDNLNLNFFNILILLGIIHGIIFSLIIAFNKKLHSKTNTFLVLTVLALVFSNLQYWLIDVELYDEKPDFIFIPFEFLMLPFFYFYVKSYLEKNISIKEYFTLLFLFVFTIIYQLIFTTKYFSFKLIDSLNLILEYISIIFSLTLIFLVFNTIIKYEKKVFSNHSIKIETKWLKTILILGVILCIIWFLSLNYFDFTHSGYYRFYPLWIGISILIYWIGYTSILKTNIYNDIKEIKRIKKNKKSTSRKNQKQKIDSFKQIENILIEQKLYLNQNLSLHTLSKISNFSEGYISQLINSKSNLNFNDFINLLRVNEAKRMLENPLFKNYTITSIGLEAGFNSKASFYRAFKKITKKTPTEYLKDVSNL